jgi:hypothetical protein
MTTESTNQTQGQLRADRNTLRKLIHQDKMTIIFKMQDRPEIYLQNMTIEISAEMPGKVIVIIVPLRVVTMVIIMKIQIGTIQREATQVDTKAMTM